MFYYDRLNGQRYWSSYDNTHYYRDNRNGRVVSVQGYYAFPPEYLEMISKEEYYKAKREQ